jgi:AraC-like DNA-binding protein
MNYDFLLNFTPRILDVVKRDHPFWETHNYELLREKTLLHVCACVYEGRGTLELGGQRYALSPGSVFLIKPGEMMRITTSVEHTLCFNAIHFQYGIVRWEGTEIHSELGTSRPPFSISQGHNLPYLLESFLEAYSNWSDKHVGYEWRVKLILLQLVQQLASAGEQAEGPSAAKAAHVAIEYMKSHYRKSVSREMLAAHVSLSPGYFSSVFKAYTGLSPVQYLNKIRLDKAKQLLKGSVLPIQQVAEEAGFSDSFYFTRLFSRETGMSPREYRNS